MLRASHSIRSASLVAIVALATTTLSWHSASAATSHAGLPLLHWSFDSGDISGSTSTNTGTGGSQFNGQIINATQTTGQFGGALSFNAAAGADYVTTPTGPTDPRPLATTPLPSGFRPYSMSAWIQTTTEDFTAYLSQYASFQSWGLFLNRFSVDQTSWYHQGDHLFTVPQLNDGAWHHVVYTRDSAGALQLYVDNVLTAFGSVDGFDHFTDAPFRAGVLDSNDGSGAFTGLIDEVYIFERALNATAINDLYTENLPEPSGAVALALASLVAMRRRSRR